MHLDSIALGSALSGQQATGGTRGASDKTRNESSESTAATGLPEKKEESKTGTPVTTSVSGVATEKSDSSEGRPEPSELEGQLLRSSRLQLSFHMDEKTDRVVISVIDKESQEVIRQVPPEEILKLAESLENIRGSFVRSTV